MPRLDELNSDGTVRAPSPTRPASQKASDTVEIDAFNYKEIVGFVAFKFDATKGYFSASTCEP